MSALTVVPRAANPPQTPHSLDAERAVLGAILIQNNAYPIAAAAIDGGAFFRDAHQRIFRAIGRMVARHEAVDLVTLTVELGRVGELDRAGGMAYIGSLVDQVPYAANVAHYCGVMNDLAKRRHLIATLNRAVDHAYGDEQVDDLIDATVGALISGPATARRAPRWQMYDDLAINNRPTPGHRWAGRLQEGGVALIVGQTETYKTFLSLGLELSSLCGRPFLGADVSQASTSISVFGEGAGFAKNRVNAWKAASGIPLDERVGLQIVDGAVNLFSADETKAFIDELVTPHAPCNVTFDTLSRCSLGADENSAKDMGIVLDNAFRVRDACRGAVTILHHANASESRERGATVMKAGVDNMLMLVKTDDMVTLSSAKNKDMDAFEPISLKLTAVPDTGSCVIRLARDVFAAGALTAAQLTVLNALWDTFGADGATSLEWQKSVPGTPERTYYHARKVLVDTGYVEIRGTRFQPRRKA